jgi:hypothetical protein
VNPLERLAERLLDWNVLQEAAINASPKSVDDVYEHPPVTSLAKLPEVYKSFDEYVEAWEPPMIADMRSGVVSKFFTLVNESARGPVTCTASKVPVEGAAVLSLDCSFAFDGTSPRLKASGYVPANKTDLEYYFIRTWVSYRDRQALLPTVMDLVLISLSPLDITTSRSPAPTASSAGASSVPVAGSAQAAVKINPRDLDPEKVKKVQQEVMLGIVVAVNTNHGEGGRMCQVHVLSEVWDRLRDKVKTGAVSVFDPTKKSQNMSRMASSAKPGKL